MVESREARVPEVADIPGSTRWDDLVDRLRPHDIRYLTGGHEWDSGADRAHKTGGGATRRVDESSDVRRLVTDLAHAREARLRDTLVALLFRHPEYASVAHDAAMTLAPTDRARLLLLSSVLAAAALRQSWSFTLTIYLPASCTTPDDRAMNRELASMLGVPPPDEDYGRACLRALSALLARDQVFPYDYEQGWWDVAGLVLEDLRVQARLAGRPVA